MSREVERIVNADRVEDLISVFGSFDENIRKIEESLDVKIINRGTDLKVSGEEESVDKAVKTLEGLLTLASKGEMIDEQRVRYLITLVKEGNDAQVSQMAKDRVADQDINPTILLDGRLDQLTALLLLHHIAGAVGRLTTPLADLAHDELQLLHAARTQHHIGT